MLVRFYGVLFLLIALQTTASAQADSGYRHMFRVVDDNDVFKLVGDVSDKGYTNGTSIEYYYIKDHTSKFFLDKWMPKAGSNAVNTFGLSLTQDMYTPTELSTTEPDVKDWPYSGGLYLTHTLHSTNPLKKYNIQTEILGGVMGKAALDKQMQTFIHSMIASDKPLGWDKEYPTDVLLNLNFQYEHALWTFHDYLEIIGGGRAMVGTMLDGASVYGYVRLGKMVPYFDGFISRFARGFHQKNHLQFFLFAKPTLDWIAYDAILQGGVFQGKSDYYKSPDAIKTDHNISRAISYGAALEFGCVSVSFAQATMPRQVDGIHHERLGSVALQVAF
jgi:lipid A 3-O-deacylase